MQTAWSGLLEDRRRDLLYVPEHSFRHLPDLPLSTIAAPYPEEMQKLPRVHGNDDLGFGRIRQKVARILPSCLSFEAQFLKPLQTLV